MDAYLYIESNDPSICGDWHASDVEDEMNELKIPIVNEWTWLTYVLDHNFEDYDIDVDALVKILSASNSIMIDILHHGTRIHIEFQTYVNNEM